MFVVLLCMTTKIMELILVPKTIPFPCLSVYAIASSTSILVLNSSQENERRTMEDLEAYVLKLFIMLGSLNFPIVHTT